MTRRALAGAVAVVIATVTVSVIEGTPHQLPGVALGSPVLLHAERALALLAWPLHHARSDRLSDDRLRGSGGDGHIRRVRFQRGTKQRLNDHYVAGHVVFGLGMIAGCVATVATASTKFSLIPKNSQSAEGQAPSAAFPHAGVLVLGAIPVVLAIVAWCFSIANLAMATTPGTFTLGHVVAGLALICTSLIALVWSILRQVQNTYGRRDRVMWPSVVIVMGSISMIWGIVLLVLDNETYYLTPGFVMTGLGLVCFSILSKVGLLALVWRRTFALANRVPLIPVLTALACLFLAAFVFQAAVVNTNVFIPARVLVGLGAICFSLYSIVSILESGTSSGG